MVDGKLPGFDVRTCATVLNAVVGGASGGSSVKNLAAMEFGKLVFTQLTNTGVSSRTTEVEAVDVFSPKKLPNTNVLFLITGPPKVNPYSFRREAGMVDWNSVRAVNALLVWNSLIRSRRDPEEFSDDAAVEASPSRRPRGFYR